MRSIRVVCKDTEARSFNDLILSCVVTSCCVPDHDLDDIGVISDHDTRTVDFCEFLCSTAQKAITEYVTIFGPIFD